MDFEIEVLARSGHLNLEIVEVSTLKRRCPERAVLSATVPRKDSPARGETICFVDRVGQW
jgi:hypothetical protein